MISKLILKNFRCFQDFTLDGIKPVTLIAGANNVGKSTLLESIFLFCDRNSSDVFLRLNGFRGIQQVSLSSQMVWESLFSNMDARNEISICLTNDNKEQAVVLSRDTSFSVSQIQDSPLPLSVQGIGTPFGNNYPLKLSYTDANNNDITHFTITAAGITLTPQKPISIVTPYVNYFSSRTSTPAQAVELFSKIEIAGNKPIFIELLKLLDDRIKDLSVTVINGVSGIYADLGLRSRLPINVIGDGVYKLMHLVLIMLANPGAILLADEIENGFHYTFFPKLWNIIGKLSEETGCQIIATSHSFECINGASDLSACTDSFRFVRLDRKDEVIVPHVFDAEAFSFAVNNEWEVR